MRQQQEHFQVTMSPFTTSSENLSLAVLSSIFFESSSYNRAIHPASSMDHDDDYQRNEDDHEESALYHRHQQRHQSRTSTGGINMPSTSYTNGSGFRLLQEPRQGHPVKLSRKPFGDITTSFNHQRVSSVPLYP